jgi:hypothetical protein
LKLTEINMESNTTDQQYFGPDLQLSEPHFDEEATLLSARRVVPLGEVRTEPRSGKRLAFGLAMVVAVIAGAFGATLIYKQRDQKATIVETSTPLLQQAVSDGQPVSGAGGAISDSNASSAAENVDDVGTREMHKNGVTAETRKSAAPFSIKAGRAKGTLQNGDSNQPDEQELRRAERMEARRLKRNAEHEDKRESRGRKRQSSDDLLRIREIFEGSPRP